MMQRSWPPRRSFRTMALRPRPGSAPRRASANPECLHARMCKLAHGSPSTKAVALPGVIRSRSRPPLRAPVLPTPAPSRQRLAASVLCAVLGITRWQMRFKAQLLHISSPASGCGTPYPLSSKSLDDSNHRSDPTSPPHAQRPPSIHASWSPAPSSSPALPRLATSASSHSTVGMTWR